jgi:hypothetical protein
MPDDAIFLTAIGLLVLATIQLYSRRFSGISQRPYHHVHGTAPGAARASRMSRADERDVDYWTRGTR